MSGIILKTPLGGSVKLEAENTSTDFIMKVPAENATLLTPSDLIESTASAGIGYQPAGTGAVATTAQAKLRETVSVFDFMTAAQIADVQSGAATLNVTAAINAAFAATYKVYFPAGIYFIGSSTITVPSNRFVFGDGVASVILADASTRSDPATDHILVLGSNSCIRDLCIDGDRENAIQQIRSVYLDGGVTNVTIENVDFKEYGAGIWIEYANRVSIQNNRFADSTVSKESVVTQGNASGYASNIIVSGNYFGKVVEEAIDVNAKTRGMMISGNVFVNSHTGPDVGDGTEAIDIGSNSDCSDITIVGNDVRNGNSADAFVWVKLGSERVTIEGNVIADLKATGEAAVRISNSKQVNVVGNVMVNVPRAVEIQERSSSVRSEFINIVGNSAVGISYEGVRLDDCTNATSGVNIADNVFKASASTSHAIWGIECNTLNVSGNNIVGFGGRGIKLDSSVTQYTVDGNTVYGCDIGVSSDASNGVISDNYITNSVQYGILLQADQISLTGNTCQSNALSGIVLNGADNCAITGNVCRSNAQYGLHVVSASANNAVVGNMFLGNTIGSIGGAASLTGSSVNASNVV